MKFGSTAKLVLFFILLVAVDQLSKYLIRLRQPADGGFYVCNKNVAFGIELEPFIFWAILALMFFPTFYILLNPNVKISITKKTPISKSKISNFFLWDFIGNWYLEIGNFKSSLLATVLIISGAVSNIIDRLYFSCVIDFIDLKFWPIFNLADIFIVSGAILLLAKYLKSYYNNKQNTTEQTK